MKTRMFCIINGTNLFVVHLRDMDEAKEKAVAICDHSKEIIVREITNILMS